ncbi:DUF4838 domain-containing protein [Propionibacteriaceae bacterium Y2011]
MARRTILAGAAGTAAALLGTRPAQASPTLTLSRNGTTEYVISVDSAAPAPVQTAARELSEWLGQVTGATFPVVDVSSVTEANPTIAVGQSLPTRLSRRARVGRNPIVLADDGVTTTDRFSLRFTGADLIIAGANHAGTLHGVFWFLTNLIGVEWYSPDTTFVPSLPTLSITDARLNSDQSPWLLHRSVLSKEAKNTPWGHRNLLTMRPVPDGNEPPPDPAWAAGSLWWPGIHPGQFKEVVTDQTLWATTQLLCMDPRTTAAAVSSLVPKVQTRIANWGDASHPFHVNDTAWVTPDPASAAFAAQHGDTLAAPVLHLINETARGLKAQVPTARLETQAYLFSQRPPTGMAVEDNVVITYAPILATMARSLWSGMNANFGEGTQLDGWRELTSEILIWDYGYAFNDMFFLCADYWSHAETLQRAAQSDAIKGYQLESSWALAGNENAALKGWLLGKIMWDPAQDVDDLILQHCKGYYGAGAGPIIHQLLRRVADDGEASSYRMGCVTSSTLMTPYLDWRTVRDAQALLGEAAALAAGDPTHAAHVTELQMAIDHWTIIHRVTYQTESATAGEPWSIDHGSLVDRQVANWNATGRQSWRYRHGGLNTLQALYDLQGQRVAPALPPELADVAADDYQLYEDGVLAQGERAVDALASDHLAAIMPGQTSWLVQLKLSNLPSEGRWKVQFRVRMDLVDGADLDQLHFELGCYPKLPTDTTPGFSTVEHYPLSDFASGDYVTVTAFGDWTYETTGRYIYLTGLSAATIRRIYVDLAWAIRV